MAQNIIQFAPNQEAGMLVYGRAYNKATVPVVVDEASTKTLTLGEPVKIVAGGTGLNQALVVDGLSAATDKIYGFIVYNQVKNTHTAKSLISEVALSDTVMFMTAGGSIQAGDKLEYDVVNKKVITYAGGSNTVLGFAESNATINQIFPVRITTPYTI
jgi:hypothetical protein